MTTNCFKRAFIEVRKTYTFETSIDPSVIPPPSTQCGAVETIYSKADSSGISIISTNSTDKDAKTKF